MTPQEQEQIVAELETALDRLQALYNQYFMGIEKMEPAVPRKEVERKIQLLRKERIRNTAIRFRFQTQIQKYNTQSNYWRRICRQIEEGTYERDVMRAKRRTAERDQRDVAAEALSAFDAEEQRDVPVVDLSGEADLGLDDPFAEPAASAATNDEGLSGITGLDDPFDSGPGANQIPDPDKTPVPIVGSGIHDLHEKLIKDAREDSGSGEDDELADFFSRRSIPPPPPNRPSVPPPPPPPTAAPPQETPRAKAQPKPKPQTRPRARPSAAAGGSAGAISEERMKAVYRAYVTARKKCNEPTKNISFEKISKLLRKQTATKKNVKDFKVVIRDGKAVIKTVKD